MIFAVGPRKSLLPVWSDWRDHGCLCCHLKPQIWCPPDVSGQTRFSSLFDDMTSLSNVCAGEMPLVQLIQLSCGLPEIKYQMIKDVHLTVWKEITYIFYPVNVEMKRALYNSCRQHWHRMCTCAATTFQFKTVGYVYMLVQGNINQLLPVNIRIGPVFKCTDVYSKMS